MTKHRCGGELPTSDNCQPGRVAECFENEKGQLWVSDKDENNCSQVNYCPYCGFRAPKQVDMKEVMEYEGYW